MSTLIGEDVFHLKECAHFVVLCILIQITFFSVEQFNILCVHIHTKKANDHNLAKLCFRVVYALVCTFRWFKLGATRGILLVLLVAFWVYKQGVEASCFCASCFVVVCGVREELFRYGYYSSLYSQKTTVYTPTPNTVYTHKHPQPIPTNPLSLYPHTTHLVQNMLAHALPTNFIYTHSLLRCAAREAEHFLL